MNIIGEFGRSVSESVLLACPAHMKSSKNAARDDLLILKDLRVGIISELDDKDRLDEKEIKRISGGDLLDARASYGKPQQFCTKAKLVTSTNHKPIFSADPAVQERLMFLHFCQKFAVDPDLAKGERLADPDIEKKLGAIKDDFFAWMVEGAKKFVAEGKLTPPESVATFSKDLIYENDDVERFLVQYTRRSEGKKISQDELYGYYVEMCKIEDIDFKSKPKFGASLKTKGIEIKKISVMHVMNLEYVRPCEEEEEEIMKAVDDDEEEEDCFVRKPFSFPN